LKFKQPISYPPTQVCARKSIIPELVILKAILCLLALLLVFLATSYPALEILCQSDAPFWKIPVPGNNASPGWITSTSGRLAVDLKYSSSVILLPNAFFAIVRLLKFAAGSVIMS
jgi:hypothetical protein